jgi:hypothetical protein
MVAAYKRMTECMPDNGIQVIMFTHQSGTIWGDMANIVWAVLYALMELVKNVDGNEVLAHLMLNIPNYYGDMTQRELAVGLADYLATRLETLRPEEASAARVLRELIKNQRLG